MKTTSQGTHCDDTRFTGNQRDGAVLAAVLIMVLLLGIFAVAIMKNGELVGIGASRGINDDRAFWAAEAGLNHAKARLQTDESFRNASYTQVVGSLGNNTIQYRCVVTNMGMEYVVVSTGTVSTSYYTATSVVEQAFQILQSGFPSVFTNMLASGGTIETSKNSEVIGNVSQTDTNVPVLGNTIYDQMLGPNTNSWTTQPGFPLYLNNQTNYYNLTGVFSLTGPIYGPGVLVIRGSGGVTIDGGVIGADVQLVSEGTINIDSSGCLTSNDVLYSAVSSGTGIDIRKDIALTNGVCAIITKGDINVQKTFKFFGLIYAGGTIVQADKAVEVTGCIVSGDDMSFKKDLTGTYNGQFTNSSALFWLFAPKMFGPNSVTSSKWREIVVGQSP